MVIGIDASRAFVAERTGTENYAYHLITHLLRLPEAKKHDFVLFSRKKSTLPRELDDYSNVRVVEIGLPYLWTQLGLAYMSWRDKVEILFIPSHTLPVWRNPRVATVVTIHGIEYKWLPEYTNLLQRWYLPWSTIYAAYHADQLICVSQHTKRELISEINRYRLLKHFDTEKINVIYEGVESKQTVSLDKAEWRVRVGQKYGIEPKKYILFVGTIMPRKNLPSLIKAFWEISNRYPDYKLVIAGRVGWRAERVLALPEERGIPDKVVFCGRVSEEVLSALYQEAALYVQSSFTEGFGLPVIEAMQQRVPVIVSSGGALSEVGAEAVRVVDINARHFAKKLAVAMAEILSNPKTQKQMIARGLERVKMLNWERCAKMTLTLITKGHKKIK